MQWTFKINKLHLVVIKNNKKHKCNIAQAEAQASSSGKAEVGFIVID